MNDSREPSDKPEVVQLGSRQRRLKSLDEFARPWPRYEVRHAKPLRLLPMAIVDVAIGVALGLLLLE